MVHSALAILALSAAIFAAFKFLFWINAVIFLRLMDRDLSRTYWRWTPVEVGLSAVASISCSAALVLRPEANEAARWLLPAVFGISVLTWLAYMARRVWLISEPKRI